MASTADRDQVYLINEVSQMVGLGQKRLREYEKMGFIRPQRQARTNNRLYSDGDIVRIRHIKRLIHEYGFTLKCVQYFLSSAPCWTIFQCDQKETCPAYRSPHQRCHDVLASCEACDGKNCTDCPVYLNREARPLVILNRTP